MVCYVNWQSFGEVTPVSIWMGRGNFMSLGQHLDFCGPDFINHKMNKKIHETCSFNANGYTLEKFSDICE
jgi:hypothetical protein